MNAIVPTESNAAAYRASTDAAGLCRAIVLQTAKTISGRKHVAVEGWEAIAIAHGCAASALDVVRVSDEGASGFKCVGVVRRMSDGQEISRGEGFLGDDEQMWAKRPVYARRAMAQTRAISRACRSAFAHVVVMIDKNLATTPAEEMPANGDGEVIEAAPANRRDAPFPQGPAKNKTELKAMGRDFWREVEGCGDAGELDSLIASHGPLIKQLREALPDWWGGGTKDGEPYEGLGEVITKKQTDLAGADGGDWRNNPLIGG